MGAQSPVLSTLFDVQLRDELRTTRKNIAKEHAVAEYRVFDDNLLGIPHSLICAHANRMYSVTDRIAEVLPGTTEELMAIDGMNKHKVATFGATVLRVTRKHLSR